MNTTFLLFSIIETIYIIYILNYFKTTIEFHHPLEGVITGWNEYLRHPIGTGLYECKICGLGNVLGYLFGVYIIIRYVLYTLFTKNNRMNELNILIKINIVLVVIATLLALIMNLNAFMYLLPVLIYEYIFVYRIKLK